MKIAVFGKTGQVATELQRRVPEGVTLEVIGRDRADFSEPKTVAAVVASIDVDAIINAVAYTAVDKAEEEPDVATMINATSVGLMAEEAARRALPLVHLSTDYVFNGAGDAPHRVDDPTRPLGAYGRSKLYSENAVRSAVGSHAIIRTSWVFSAHGSNFVKTMLRLGGERESLTVVADQIGGPTPAAAIADVCYAVAKAISEDAVGGTYHFTGAPDVSWADFAREIFRQANIDCKVIDIPTSDYPTPAQRPSNSRLDCSLLEKTFGIERPDWKAGLADVLKELGA